MTFRFKSELNYGSILLGILGGGVFLALFYFHYSHLEPDDFKYRDDGIITLSHAKNLADFGHIGVEPSGQRLEGYSAPFQFWVYFAVYKVSGMGYHAFLDMQTAACTFLLGFVFALFFRDKTGLALVILPLAGWYFIRSTSFIEWHASGMENAWTHLLFLSSLFLLYRASRVHRINLAWVLLFFLASISRTDSIFHIAPLLLAFAFWWWSEMESKRGFALLGLTLVLWGAYQGFRFLYFGSLVPNTGLAQGINLKENLGFILSGNEDYLRKCVYWSKELFRAHGGWFIPFILLLMPFGRRSTSGRLLVLLCLTLVATAFLNPIVFGPTRLDIGRSTSFLALSIGLLLFWQLGQVLLEARNFRLFLPMAIAAGILIHILGLGLFDKPRHLCCSVMVYDEILDKGLKFEAENGLRRLCVSAPDLGKLSYGKQFNLLDLGYLGSPLMASLADKPDYLRNYYYDFAAPDMIELHTEWCIHHGRLFSDPRFRQLYTPLRESRANYMERFGQDWPGVSEGIFVRKSLLKEHPSAEGQLIRGLAEGISVDLLKDELEKAMQAGDPLAHQYVVRTAYRFMPEFREMGLAEEVITLFEDSPSPAYDQALLGSCCDRKWLARALGFLLPYLQQQEIEKFQRLGLDEAHIVGTHGRWRLYVGHNGLENEYLLGLLAPTESEMCAPIELSFDLPSGQDRLQLPPIAEGWSLEAGEYFIQLKQQGWKEVIINCNGEKVGVIEVP